MNKEERHIEEAFYTGFSMDFYCAELFETNNPRVYNRRVLKTLNSCLYYYLTKK